MLEDNPPSPPGANLRQEPRSHAHPAPPDPAALLQHRELYERLLEDSSEAVFVTRDGVILIANPAALQLLGAERREQVIGRSALEFIQAEGRHAASERLARLLAGGPASSHRERYTRLDGTAVDAEVVSSAVRSGDEILVQTVARRLGGRKLGRSRGTRRALLRQFLDGIPLGILIFDRQSRLVYANESASGLLGSGIQPGVQLRDMPWFQTARLLESGLPYPLESPAISQALHGKYRSDEVELFQDGRKMQVEVWASPIAGHRGTIRFAIAAFRNLSERKRLEETQRRLLTILEGSPDFVYMVDMQLRPFFINDACKRLLGCGGEDELPLDSIAGFHPAWAFEKMRDESIPAALRDGTWIGQTALLAREGREIPVLQVVQAHRSADGSLEFLSTQMRDLTLLRKAELDLRQSHLLLHTVVEGMIDAIYVKNRKGKYLMVNAAGARLLGKKSSEIVGMDDAALLPPDQAIKVLGEDRAILASGAIRQVEESVVIGGEERILLTTKIPFRSPQGRANGLIVISKDITDRVKAEVESREREKLSATGRMAARIAHEINNPLAGIKNAFYLVKDSVPSNSQHFSFVGRIDQEIDRLARIVHRMVALYRPDHERPRKFSLNAALKDVLGLLNSRGLRPDLKVEVLTQVDPLFVFLPESPVVEILLNVIANAFEASPLPGTIIIDVAMVRNEVRIEVLDEGPGIAEELRERIFEPFFTTKPAHEGSSLGLGLTVSRSLAQSIGGRLEFERRMEKGTCFRIYLPQRIF